MSTKKAAKKNAKATTRKKRSRESCLLQQVTRLKNINAELRRNNDVHKWIQDRDDTERFTASALCGVRMRMLEEVAERMGRDFMTALRMAEEMPESVKGRNELCAFLAERAGGEQIQEQQMLNKLGIKGVR